jgi:hypothetical protein
MEIQLYKKKYKGTKVTFNSRKGAGKIVEGIAVDIDDKLQVVILRDADNFPHCVSIMTLEEI